jgi:hypothetical protein
MSRDITHVVLFAGSEEDIPPPLEPPPLPPGVTEEDVALFKSAQEKAQEVNTGFFQNYSSRTEI